MDDLLKAFGLSCMNFWTDRHRPEHKTLQYLCQKYQVTKPVDVPALAGRACQMPARGLHCTLFAGFPGFLIRPLIKGVAGCFIAIGNKNNACFYIGSVYSFTAWTNI